MRVTLLLILLFAGQRICAQSPDTIVSFLIHSRLDSIVNSPSISLSAKDRRYIDSLEHESKVNNSDSLRTEARLSIAFFYQRLDYRTSRKIYFKFISDSVPSSSMFFKGCAYWGLGNIQYDRGDYVNSVINYEKAIASFQQSRADVKVKTRYNGLLLNNLGALSALLNDLDVAHNYYTRSIEQLEILHDSVAIAIAYYNISYIFSDIKEWGRAREYLLKSVVYLSDIKDPSHCIVNLCRLTSVCFELSQYKEAISYLKRPERLMKQKVDHLAKSYYYNAIGQKLRIEGNVNLAIKTLVLAYQEAVLYNDPYFIAEQARELSLTFRKEKKYKEAELYLGIFYKLAKAFDYKPMVSNALNEYSELEKMKGNLAKALDYKTAQQLYTDSLVRAHNHSRIFLFDTRFQAEKKEQEILRLQKEGEIQSLILQRRNTLLYFTVGAFCVLCFVGVLIYRNSAQQHRILKQNELLKEQKIQALEKDNQLLVADSILKGQEEERKRMAKDLHDGLGGLLSGVKFTLVNMKTNVLLDSENVLIFERALDMLDHSISELRRVAHNMMPDSLIKFGLVQAVKDYCESINTTGIFKIDFQTVEMVERLPGNTEIIVYRIIQELLNNIAKHGKANQVLVQLSRHGKHLSITVEDDGIGFDKNQPRKGDGWINIQSRVEYLKGKLDLQTTPGLGTSVVIDFIIES